MAYQSKNPANGETTKRFEVFTDEQLEQKIVNAVNCFKVWKEKPYSERAKIVARASALMLASVDKFASHVTLEMGKLINESRGEVHFSADILSYYAKNAEKFLAPVKLNPKQGEAHMESSPIGVVFAIQPWNFPYYQLARIAGPHLMAGNTLLVKHAACVPQCAIEFEKLWIDAGAPEGLYTNLFISNDQAEKIIDDPRTKGFAFTGSVTAGKILSARAGSAMKVSSMELGGSDAFVVLEDADLDLTIPWALWGRMHNAGQTCCAAKRFIVVDEIADAFLAKFKTAMGSLVPGDPMDEKTSHGPLSSEIALQKILKQVEDAVSNGATLLMGGKRLDRIGSYMETTILTNISPKNPAFRDEFFGPVALFFRVKNEEEAIALANDSDFGLGGSVFTKDLKRGERVASQIEAGMMFINNIDWADAELPFGGVKNSGYGRELGDMGIHQFVNKKMIRTHNITAPSLAKK